MKRLKWMLILTVLIYAVPSQAASVIRDGKEWLQPIDFVGLTWNDVAAVCAPAPGDGLCNGTLNDIDVTGYTWADLEDMNVLLDSFGVNPAMSGQPPTFRLELDSAWAPAFFLEFLAIDQDQDHVAVSGVLRDHAQDYGYEVLIGDVFDTNTADYVFTDGQRNKETNGARPWLYRQVADQHAVTLAGTTRLPQLPDAAVTIWVGGQSTTTVADSEGRFSSDVEINPGLELIRVEACGVGYQAKICYVRLVHTASEILSRASVDGSYQVGNLSPVSTAAWAALLKPIPDQVIPVTFADIAQFQFGFVTSVLTDASLLALIAQGAATMPVGAPDFVSLLLDPALRSSALDSVSFELQSQQKEALVQNDSFMLRPEEEFEILGKNFMVPLGTEMSSFVTSRIELNPDGSGNYAGSSGSGDASWINVGKGDLIFRDDMEAVGTGTRYISITAPDRDSITPPTSGYAYLPDIGSVLIETRTTEVQWRQLDASELLSIGVQRTTEETVAPDYPDLGTDQIPWLGVSMRSSDSISISGQADVPPSPLPTDGSQWAFPRCETDCTTPGFISGIPSLDVLSFNADGMASARIFDPGLNWTVTDGRVLIDQDDGFSLDVLPLGTARRSGDSFGDLETTIVVTEITAPDGGSTISSKFVLEADSGFLLTEQSVPGTYNVYNLFPGTYILEAAGSGWRLPLGSVDPGDPLPSDPPNLTWSISPTGDLVMVYRGTYAFVSTPVRAGQTGFYAINRFGTIDANPTASGGLLSFWEEISD